MDTSALAPGVLTASARVYVGIADVMMLLRCQKSKASDYIKNINKMAEEQGGMAFPSGKANKYLFAKLSSLPMEDINMVLEANDRKEALAQKYFRAHQKATEDWTEGKIKSVWIDEAENIRIAYESGKWWHYREKKDGRIEWW